MNGKQLLITPFVLLTLYIHAQQDISYAKQVVKSLASEEMAGRGYIKDGHTKAAHFIATEYKKWGLQWFDGSYYQDFPVTVNTFPGNVSCSLNGKDLIPGVDFIVAPFSPKIDTSFDVITLKRIPKKNKKGFSNAFVYVPYKRIQKSKNQKELNHLIQQNTLRAKGIIRGNEKKLTFSYAQEQRDYTIIDVMDPVVPKKIKTIQLTIEPALKEKVKTQNVIGYIPGTEKPDSFIVFSGHYDHLGMMGPKANFPGANDNASGIAMILELAKYYTAHPSKYSIVFMAFGAEEVGILGSKYFVENPLFDIHSIRFLINMDILGTGDEGIQIVNSTVFTDEYEMLQQINEEHQLLKQIKKRGKAQNSDHFWFTEKGVRSFFIYTLGGISAYHDVYDKAETLPLTEFEDLSTLFKLFVEKLEN